MPCRFESGLGHDDGNPRFDLTGSEARAFLIECVERIRKKLNLLYSFTNAFNFFWLKLMLEQMVSVSVHSMRRFLYEVKVISEFSP